MFAPMVILARKFLGTKEFNKLRGKAIGLHCKTITNFCNSIGMEGKTRQKLIRTAKSNGHKLGLLA